jgi:hypothetical protein
MIASALSRQLEQDESAGIPDEKPTFQAVATVVFLNTTASARTYRRQATCHHRALYGQVDATPTSGDLAYPLI